MAEGIKMKFGIGVDYHRGTTIFIKRVTPKKVGNVHVTPLVFQVSMGGGDCLPSGDTSARLPAYTIKKT
uniref:SFRICE_028971 n=1 Tax=Spodoptera frugiperda TaxID=7108 RepID=A0A2H1WZW9_SPOFR